MGSTSVPSEHRRNETSSGLAEIFQQPLLRLLSSPFLVFFLKLPLVPMSRVDNADNVNRVYRTMRKMLNAYATKLSMVVG